MSTAAPERQDAVTTGAGPVSVAATPRERRRLLLRHLGTPLGLAVASLLLLGWLSTLTLDDIERRTLNWGYFTDRLVEHVRLTAISSVIVAVLALGLGILLTRSATRWLAPPVIGLANIGQAAPAIGLLVLLTFPFGLGVKTALIALVAYSVLPVLRNVIVGIDQVDPALTEAGRGLGMSSVGLLWKVELPLAVPVILAGLRTALVLNVGVATLATFINAGGLGGMIVNGIKLQRYPVLIAGGCAVAILALLIDWLGSLLHDFLRPSGT